MKALLLGFTYTNAYYYYYYYFSLRLGSTFRSEPLEVLVARSPMATIFEPYSDLEAVAGDLLVRLLRRMMALLGFWSAADTVKA